MAACRGARFCHTVGFRVAAADVETATSTTVPLVSGVSWVLIVDAILLLVVKGSYKFVAVLSCDRRKLVDVEIDQFWREFDHGLNWGRGLHIFGGREQLCRIINAPQ